MVQLGVEFLSFFRFHRVIYIAILHCANLLSTSLISEFVQVSIRGRKPGLLDLGAQSIVSVRFAPFVMATFLAFNKVEDKNRIKTLEMQFLKEEGILGPIIKKKNVSLVFCEASQNTTGLFLVMVVAGDDTTAQFLGRDHLMPRGFPILWSPGLLVRHFGFFPKFRNDRGGVSGKKIVARLNFFKKWSGFLAQVMAFEWQGAQYWTVATKNTANFSSFYVADAYRIIAPYMTPSLISALIKEERHFCAEIISRKDQMHASTCKREAAVVLCVAKRLELPTDKSGFVQYASIDEVVQFAHEHALDVDSAVMVVGTETVLKFRTRLHEYRDLLDDAMLESILTEFKDQVTITKGTVTHAEIVGNVLEGIVLHVMFENRQTKIEKYKLAGYTVREMLIGPNLRHYRMRDDASPYQDETRENANEAHEDIESFTRRWTKTKAGTLYWASFAKRCFTLAWEGIPFELVQGVGYHIQVADYVQEHGDSITINEALFRNNATVLLVTGPLGVNKAGIAQHLANHVIPNAVYIDCNRVGELSVRQTQDLDHDLKIGALRYRVVDALLSGRIPVLSTSGALAFGYKLEPELRRAIRERSGLDPKIVTLFVGAEIATPLERVGDDDITIEQAISLIKPRYLDTGDAKRIVKARLDAGTWVNTSAHGKDEAAFITKTVSRATGTLMFVEPLLRHSHVAFLLPKTESTPNIDWTALINEIVPVDTTLAQSVLARGSQFKKMRLLFNVVGSDHVAPFSMPVKGDWFQAQVLKELATKFKGEVEAIKHRCHASKKQAFVFVRMDVPVDEDDTFCFIVLDALKHRETRAVDFIRALEAATPSIDLDGVTYDLATQAFKSSVKVRLVEAFCT